MTDDPKAEVLSRFPGAVAMLVPIGGGERRWVVVAEPDWPWRFPVGGGDTEAAAWASARESSGRETPDGGVTP